MDSRNQIVVNDVLTNKQLQQLKCINRVCKSGDKLLSVVEVVCIYYRVKYKRNKQVCTSCFNECIEHLKLLEKKFNNNECVIDTYIPTFESHFVIESSSEEEEMEPQPSTSRYGMPLSHKFIERFTSICKEMLESKKPLFYSNQNKCKEFLTHLVKYNHMKANKIDILANNIESEMTKFKNEFYGIYKSNIEYVDSIDIDDTMDITIEENKIDDKDKKNDKNKNNSKQENNVEVKVNKKIKLNEENQNNKKNELSHDKQNDKNDDLNNINQLNKTNKIDELNIGNLNNKKNELNKENLNNKTNKTYELNKKNSNNKTKEEDLIDKDIITINSTVCAIPASLPKEGPLEYPFVRKGLEVYAMKKTLLDPWIKCIIKNSINEDYVHITFGRDDEKLLTTKEIAYYSKSPVQFPVGCRVIAKFSDANVCDMFYAGIIAEPPKILNQYRYLIFFDDGFVQYRYHRDIRLIIFKSNQVWNDVHPNSKEFIKNYLDKYPERQMVRLNKKNTLRVEHNKQWQLAKVLDVDASLVKLFFIDLKQTEWLYRGSSRIWNIFEKQSKYEKGIRLRQSGLAYLNKPFVEFSSVEEGSLKPIVRKCVARKSTSKSSISSNEYIENSIRYKSDPNYKLTIVKLPKAISRSRKFRVHICDNSCVEWTAYRYNRTKQINMLAIPLHFGFSRYIVYFYLDTLLKCVMYRTPCGRVIRNMKEMQEYLFTTKSQITIDLFDFSSWVEPLVEFKVVKCVRFMDDLSAGKEFKPITCVNTMNFKLPPSMEYMTTRRAMPGVNINVDPEFLCGCDCTDDCQDKSKCACWKMTFEGQQILPNLYNDPNIGYNYRRLPERVLTGIYECNKTCKCSKSCLNRVVQNSLSQKLQLFLTEKKGWGVRCLNDIPQGSFICIYVGYLLTETDANEGGKNYGDEYLAELDYIEVVEKIKEDYESDVFISDEEYSDENDDEDLILTEDFHNIPSTSSGYNPDSEFFLRLRKRKRSEDIFKIKKDIRHIHVPSQLNARDMKNNPEVPKSMREYFGDNESVYIMDAKTCGNIGRYLNHSCSPNTFVQNVFVDTHDLRFPWISFFALNYISAGSELTWDYSYDIGSVPGKTMKCHCKSVHCRGRLL